MRLGCVAILPWRVWKCCWITGDYFGIFRNHPGIIPGRWGFYVFGFEIGNRNPGDRFGMWLKRIGLWRV